MGTVPVAFSVLDGTTCWRLNAQAFCLEFDVLAAARGFDELRRRAKMECPMQKPRVSTTSGRCDRTDGPPRRRRVAGIAVALAAGTIAVTLVLWLLWIANRGLLYEVAWTHQGTCGGTCLAFSSDDSLLACGSSDGTLALWESRSGRMLHVMQASGSAIGGLAFADADRRLYSGGEDGYVRAWDTQSGRKLAEFAVPGGGVL